VRAYFDIYAVLGGAVTVGMVVSVVTHPFGHDTHLPKPWLSIPAGIIFTWGSVRTSQLLRDRQRSGAWAAIFTFATSFVAVGSYTPSLTTAARGLIGLGLLASVWRHLE